MPPLQRSILEQVECHTDVRVLTIPWLTGWEVRTAFWPDVLLLSWGAIMPVMSSPYREALGATCCE